MGEAGIGKTALLRHIVKYIYNHEFEVFNINAGLPLQSPKLSKELNKLTKEEEKKHSLMNMVESIKTTYE